MCAKLNEPRGLGLLTTKGCTHSRTLLCTLIATHAILLSLRSLTPLTPLSHSYPRLLQVMQSSSVYAKLNERLGLADHQGVLTLMLGKVATNLKVYGNSEQLVHLTLSLFQVCELCRLLVCVL